MEYNKIYLKFNRDYSNIFLAIIAQNRLANLQMKNLHATLADAAWNTIHLGLLTAAYADIVLRVHTPHGCFAFQKINSRRR